MANFTFTTASEKERIKKSKEVGGRERGREERELSSRKVKRR